MFIFSTQLRIRNPFFLEAHGECGIQMIRRSDVFNRLKRNAEDESINYHPKVVGSHDAFRGEVPWQAIIHVNHTGKGSIIIIY